MWKKWRNNHDSVQRRLRARMTVRIAGTSTSKLSHLAGTLYRVVLVHPDGRVWLQIHETAVDEQAELYHELQHVEGYMVTIT